MARPRNTARGKRNMGNMEAPRPTLAILKKAIHDHCFDCCGGDRKLVYGCKAENCSLWPYRPQPTAKKDGSAGKEEQQISIVDLLAQ